MYHNIEAVLLLLWQCLIKTKNTSAGESHCYRSEIHQPYIYSQRSDWFCPNLMRIFTCVCQNIDQRKGRLQAGDCFVQRPCWVQVKGSSAHHKVCLMFLPFAALRSLSTWVSSSLKRQSDTHPLSERENIDFRGAVDQIGNIKKMTVQAFYFRMIKLYLFVSVRNVRR